MSCKYSYYNNTSEEFRELFKEELKNYNEKHGVNEGKKKLSELLEDNNSLTELIYASFYWHETKDGVDFWCKIIDNLISNKKYLKEWTRE